MGLTEHIKNGGLNIVKFEQIVSVLDALTWVEIKRTGYGIIYSGRLKDIKPQDMIDYRVYEILPCSTSRETYLEIRVL